MAQRDRMQSPGNKDRFTDSDPEVRLTPGAHDGPTR
jgi:hypothetical protein